MEFVTFTIKIQSMELDDVVTKILDAAASYSLAQFTLNLLAQNSTIESKQDLEEKSRENKKIAKEKLKEALTSYAQEIKNEIR